MPQMAPLLWINLYIFFTIVFMLVIIMNFYTKPPIKIKSPLTSTTKPSHIWSW